MARRTLHALGVFAWLVLAAPTPARGQCRYQTLNHYEFQSEAHFGHSLAVDGDTAAVASRAQLVNEVTILERGALDWRTTQILTIPSLSAAAMALQGDTLLVHARGAVYGHDVVQVYERQGGTWTWVQDLAPDPAAFKSGFGRAIALDGDVAVVGAPVDSREAYHSGAAFVFERKAGTWTQVARLGGGKHTGFLGYSVSVRGEEIALGEPQPIQPTSEVPAVHHYWRNSAGTWLLQDRWDGPWNSRFGSTVMLSPVGELLVGAPDRASGSGVRGTVFVYESVAGNWILEQELATDESGKDSGFGAAIAADRNRIVVGTGKPGTAWKGGHGAHVFERVAGIWTETVYLAAPGPREPKGWAPPPMGNFGWVVALGSEDLLVSAPTEDFAEADRGAVHVYALAPEAENYCGPANLNSTGAPGEIAVAGCATLFETSFGLSATNLPAHEVGVFLAGFAKGFVANVGGSQGNLCIASPLRFDPPVTSDAGGAAQLAIDLYPMIFKGGGTHWPAHGETLVFQLWFRDQNPGPTSNLTDGLAVTFK